MHTRGTIMSDTSETGPDPQDEAAGENMHIHKPKAPHGLREFLTEIGVIVVGILIALSLEQGVEAWCWHEKTEGAETAVRTELSDQLAYATLLLKLKPGFDARIAKLAGATAAGDHGEVARLAALPAPFVMRPWSSTAWDAAASEQIVSRLDPHRRRIYELMHRQVQAELDLEWRIKDNYATLLGARLPAGGDAAAAQQIAAADHLRSDSDMASLVGKAMVEEADAIGLKPTPERLSRGLSDAAACSAAAAGSTTYVC